MGSSKEPFLTSRIFLPDAAPEESMQKERNSVFLSRILVVSDVQRVLTFYCSVLETCGYAVETCLFQYEGVTQIDSLRPDLVIFDFLLENVQEQVGWQLLRSLKEHSSTVGLPVMVCAFQTPTVLEQLNYFRQNQIQIVFKPFSIQEFLQCVLHTLLPPV
jgi:two-component system, OmpR family, response regulator VicR